MTDAKHNADALVEAAVDAARDETPGLSSVQAEQVLRRVRAELRAEAKPERDWRWVRWAGLAGVAAAVLVAFSMSNQSSPVVAPPVELAEVSRVVFRHGAVEAQGGALESDATQVAMGAELALEANARVDLDLHKEAKVAIFGPARVARLTRSHVRVDRGRAVFSVDKHTEGTSFTIAAGDSEIIVHGTQFDVRVQDNKLVGVNVTEGKVEVRGPNGNRFLSAGESLGETSDDPARVFDAPWWSRERRERSGEGYLVVHSEPSGALVRLGDSGIGRTPLLVRWPAGRHPIRVEMDGAEKDEYLPYEGEARSSAGKIVHIRAQLALTSARVPEEPTPDLKTKPARGLWTVARAHLEARRCRKLDNVVRQIARETASVSERARAETLRAECQLRRGNKKIALGLFQKIAADYPDTASAEASLYETGKIQAEVGQTTKGLETVQRYLELHKDGKFVEPATARRCELLVALNRLEDARTCLMAYRSNFPKGLRAHQATLLLATIERVEGRWVEAARLYREYLASSSESSRAEEARYHLVRCLRLGGLDGVDAAIDDFLDQHPSGPHAEELKAWRSTP